MPNAIQTKLTDYEGFVEKFEPKKTTDDCYTPQPVYDEVLKFVGELTDLTGREIVRPFWPGGDYERHHYPKGCIVVDNPPFSIYAKIVRFFLAHHIDFFLFAPALTQTVMGAEVCYVICMAEVTYENGAVVRTSFTTNLVPDKRVIVSGSLYPCCYVRRLDNMPGKNGLFGAGFLLSDTATAVKMDAERRARDIKDEGRPGEETVKIELSQREKAVVEIINKNQRTAEAKGE